MPFIFLPFILKRALKSIFAKSNLFFSAVWLRDLMVFAYSANAGIVLTVSFIRIESG